MTSPLVNYEVECPLCRVQGLHREVGLYPSGIACPEGHTFEEIPSPSSVAKPTGVAEPKSEPSAESQSVSPAGITTAAVADTVPEPLPAVPGGYEVTGFPENMAATSEVLSRRVAAGGSVRLPGRDLLFGLVIPEGVADNMTAYAEEQRRPVADLIQERLIQVLEQEWWR